MKCHDLSVYDPNDLGPQRYGPRKLFKGGGGGTSTTVQSIPSELKPLASAYTDKAINLGQQGYAPYSGQRFAGLNSAQGNAIGMTADRAMNGSPEMAAGSNTLTNTLNGGFLNGSPHLQSQIDQGAQSLTRNYQNAANSTDATMARSGAFGGSAWQQAQQGNARELASTLGNLENNVRFNNYNMERGNQMQALGLAPTYGNQAYQDASQLMKAGQVLQDQQQQGLDYNYQQFQEQQNLPYKQLAAMSGVFGSNLGSTSTTNQTGGGK
jgi:hypothetical protein